MILKKKQISEKQIHKYNRLTQTSTALPTLDLQRTVVNLSDQQLSPEETSLLAKGGNYAVTPSTVPVEDIISKIESGIRTLPNDEAEVIRRESSRILHRAKPPRTTSPKRREQHYENSTRTTTLSFLLPIRGTQLLF